MKRAFLMAALVACQVSWAPIAIAEPGYLVEILVFRHSGNATEPLPVVELRGFHDVFDLSVDTGPGTPRLSTETGSTFSGLWSRLDRLTAYDPLAIMTYRQNRVDYHPPVRIHDEEVIAEELYFPGQVFILDLTSTDPFTGFVVPLYRLDGSVQLRRSRFLHLDLDLEYRVDNPGWNAAPLPTREELEQAVNENGLAGTESMPGTDEEQTEEQPFKVYTLQQSRQVKTDTIQYFDTSYLGVLARVTAIDPAEP